MRPRQVNSPIAEAGLRFADRARFYGWADRRVGDRTGFFRAAAWINRILVKVAQYARLGRCSAHMLQLVEALGESLRVVNLAILDRVDESNLVGDALDRYLIHIEQCAAEKFLLQARHRDPHQFAVCLREIDALLNRQWCAPLALSADLRRFLRVLRAVRRSLGVPVSFADQAHREKIGLSLIQCHRSASHLPVVDAQRVRGPAWLAQVIEVLPAGENHPAPCAPVIPLT